MLPLLSGTSDGTHWSFSSNGPEEVDAGQAIFAIAAFDGSSAQIIGTGFYITPKGHFITARHVVEEIDKIGRGACQIINILPDKQYILRPLGGFDVHPTSDIALGSPMGILHKGKEYLGKVVPITFAGPPKDTPVCTWAHPRHKVNSGPEGLRIELEPDFYDGVVEEFYETRGPSGKISPPYYQTNIHLHGSASGGPVFDPRGSAFGVASTSYDGMVDFSFVTPVAVASEIEVDLPAEDGTSKKIKFGELASAYGLLRA